MKFLLWRGRFPKMRLELPRDAVAHIARQVDVDPGELAAYDLHCPDRPAPPHRAAGADRLARVHSHRHGEAHLVAG
ncbi:hypothetical protein ACFVWY_32995 [Streptomyces sp. NPDC058195]|uniref:hypothetical protein n=1 Tax=Streptomyces sp. NPDC058195 TaxID=3346375 RepID=UPI0036E14C2A